MCSLHSSKVHTESYLTHVFYEVIQSDLVENRLGIFGCPFGWSNREWFGGTLSIFIG